MLTVKQILRDTPQYTKELSKDVAIRDVKRGVTKDGLLRIAARVKSNPIVGSKIRKPVRTVLIEVCERDTRAGQGHVRVYCSCEFFQWYGCADVLYKNGAGWAKYATGIMPDTRNPKHIKMCCKHVARMFTEIQNKGW